MSWLTQLLQAQYEELCVIRLLKERKFVTVAQLLVGAFERSEILSAENPLIRCGVCQLAVGGDESYCYDFIVLTSADMV